MGHADVKLNFALPMCILRSLWLGLPSLGDMASKAWIKSVFCYLPNRALTSATDGSARIFTYTAAPGIAPMSRRVENRDAPDWELNSGRSTD